jgi:AraC-like DNA-binding protein
MNVKLTRNDFTCHHITDIPDPKAFPKHMHNGYELLFFIRGDADYMIEGSVYRLRENDLLLISPRTYHCLKPLSPIVYERFVINFPADMIPESVSSFVANAPDIINIPKDSPIYRFYQNWMDAEMHFTVDEMLDFVEISTSQLLIFLKYLPDKKDIQPIRKNNTLQMILEFIDEHPTENINAEKLSAMFYMSPSWIVHTFRRELGINLMQYIAKKRILYAESLIRNGESPTEAAKICEYDSYVTFYRQYKKILGRSPKEDIPSHMNKMQ